MNAADPPPIFAEPDVALALDAILGECGYEFHGYQQVFIRRRLRTILSETQLPDLPTLANWIANDPSACATVMRCMSISVTEMFRDPTLFAAIREQVVPVLKTYPFVKIWVAGCASGEEAFSLAILLTEEGLEGRFQIYATDIDEGALQRAQAGILPVGTMKTNTTNYQEYGGRYDFSYYYTAAHGMAILGQQWRSPILFSRHDLSQGSSFSEFQLILCRNVLIYFGKDLQERVHDLLFKSLAPFGFLVLGQKEAIRFSAHGDEYVPVDPVNKIFKRRL